MQGGQTESWLGGLDSVGRGGGTSHSLSALGDDLWCYSPKGTA